MMLPKVAQMVSILKGLFNIIKQCIHVCTFSIIPVLHVKMYFFNPEHTLKQLLLTLIFTKVQLLKKQFLMGTGTVVKRRICPTPKLICYLM